MPRHLSRALDIITTWADNDTPFWMDPDWKDVCSYLDSIANWQRLGFVIAPADRQRIVQLCKRGRATFFDKAIGYYVCEEFRRLFFRQGGHGDVAAWTKAFPDLRVRLVDHLRPLTRRYRHPELVVRACATLTRDLGEPPEMWRAAALAINYLALEMWRLIELRSPNERLWWRLEYLENSWRTIALSDIRDDEWGHICRFRKELSGGWSRTVLDSFWSYPEKPKSDAYALGEVVRAAANFAADRWGAEDIHTYASVLASLPDPSNDWRCGRWDREKTPYQEEIDDVARQLRAPAARRVG